MNVRELVNVIKFKTDTATMKAAESAIAKIRDTMSKIRPTKVAMHVNTAPAYKQLNDVQTKLNSISRGKTVKLQLNAGGVEKRIDTLNRKLDRLSGQKNMKVSADTAGVDKAIGRLNVLDRTQQRVIHNGFRAKAQGAMQMPQKQTPQRQRPVQTDGGMSAIAGGLKGAFVALGGMAIVSEIKETADAMMSLSSRIKLVTKDDAERLRVEGALYAMANRNRASLQDLGDLYYKTASAAKQFGASQEDVLKLTDIVSKSLIVGGADTAQQKSTILQLSQALSSGVLQGDELRSLRENAPRLMQEIAKNMGTTMAGLKEMGAKGELTTERLMQAILQSGGAIEGEFARMTPTIGQALTVLGNKWDKFVLDIQNNTGFFGQIALFILDAIDWVGEAIDFVKEEFKDLEPEFTAFFGSLKELWTELQPFLNNLKEIFKTIIIPALKEFGKVALEVLTSVANLLKPIADLLSTISGLIVSAAKGLKGLIKNAESGALQQYKSYMAEYNQTNTFNLSSGVQLQPAAQSTREFFPTK